jgi:ABC-2 type transport system permease protein
MASDFRGVNCLAGLRATTTMKKILFVIRQEIVNTLTRPSFLITAFGVPVIATLAFIGLSIASREAPQAVTGLLGTDERGPVAVEGFVDESGLIRSVPASLPEGSLRAYPGEEAARQALQSGEIGAYYLIPAGYLETGEIIYVQPDFNPLSAFDQGAPMRIALRLNLLGGDVRLADLIRNPLDLEIDVLQPGSERAEDHPLTFYLPYGVTLLYYVAILMSASFLLSSLAKEKENRVLEILLLSTTPRQLLTGKIIGLGLMGLLQNLLWVGTGYSLLSLSGQTFDLPDSYQLPLDFLAWSVVFFILGYAIYASLMAAVGALVPNMREASQATFVVILPMIIPLMLISILVEQPNGALALGLSLFPLTSPVTMMARLAMVQVPLWQILAAVLLMVVTAALIVRSVASLFQTQLLLSGQPFSIRLLFGTLAGRY